MPILHVFPRPTRKMQRIQSQLHLATSTECTLLVRGASVYRGKAATEHLFGVELPQVACVRYPTLNHRERDQVESAGRFFIPGLSFFYLFQQCKTGSLHLRMVLLHGFGRFFKEEGEGADGLALIFISYYWDGVRERLEHTH